MDNVNERQHLEEINKHIGIEESKGGEEAYNWLNNIIAPKLAFFRANKIIDGREEYLDKVRFSEPADRITEIEDVILNCNRAIVTCIVKMNGKKFHNVRLFVKMGGEWKLLGWANEQMDSI